LGGGGGLIL